jgi:hypothetical protein
MRRTHQQKPAGGLDGDALTRCRAIRNEARTRGTWGVDRHTEVSTGVLPQNRTENDALTPSKKSRPRSPEFFVIARTSNQCTNWESISTVQSIDRTIGRFVLYRAGLLRKEVIQPHLPVRLPCYDFTPITNPTFDSSFPKG